MISLLSSTSRFKARVERLMRYPLGTRLPASVAAACLFAIAWFGRADATFAADKSVRPDAAAETNATKTADNAANGAAQESKLVTLHGRCVDGADRSAMAGIRVRLFKAEGRTAPIVEAARTVTDDEGRFEFPDVVSPRPHDSVDQLIYLLFAEAENRPLGTGGTWTLMERDPLNREIQILRDATTFSGTIFNARGEPIAGATVAQWGMDGRAVPGMLSATTDADGRFEIKRIPDFQKAFGREFAASFTVSHPDYALTDIKVPKLPADLEVVLSDGCVVTGTVADRVTGKPAAGATITAIESTSLEETPVATGADGRFRMVLAEGRYHFRVDARDRVGVALVDRECLAGEKVDLPPLELIGGGFISGRVLDTATGEPVAESRGQPIMLGLTGPTHPQGKVRSPTRLTSVDADGKFTLRAAPGDNFPYFVNIRGDRMAWDTLKQPPVVVEEGKTTVYDMLITPQVPPADKLASARKLVASLPAAPAERTEQILAQFRKLSRTVDETELWCMLMRELVAVGRQAVPSLCAELDRVTEDRALRRLAFALRAIGDARAVPALIRALPKTLLPASSDYGLLIKDAELTAFMQKHDLNPGQQGTYFDLGRPVREVCGALSKLTGQTTDDPELFGIMLSEDPRRQILQRRMFLRNARRWQAWWEGHWRDLTEDAAYREVKLNVVDEPLPAASKTLSAQARLSEGTTGAILSPAAQGGQHARYFCDLDTGFQPQWPANIAKDETQFDERQLADWAAKNGVDLMCVACFAPDKTETFVLRGFGLQAWEISPRDVRNLDKLVAAGKLPEGRPVGDHLMHYDSETEQYTPDANAAFLYITREGSLGLIETTDRVTRTEDLTGSLFPPPRGVGFFKGVRFNLKTIIP